MLGYPVVNEQYQYKAISSTGGLIQNGQGTLQGIFVGAASGGPTITVYDNTAGSGTTIVAVFTPAVSTFYKMPCFFGTGLFVVLGGTVTATVFYN